MGLLKRLFGNSDDRLCAEGIAHVREFSVNLRRYMGERGVVGHFKLGQDTLLGEAIKEDLPHFAIFATRHFGDMQACESEIRNMYEGSWLCHGVGLDEKGFIVYELYLKFGSDLMRLAANVVSFHSWLLGVDQIDWLDDFTKRILRFVAVIIADSKRSK